MLTNQEILRNSLIQLKDKIIANSDRAGQRASGKTAESFEVRTTENTGELWARTYIGVLETGRKKGGMPPMKNIREWIEAKGIQPRKKISLNSLAFLIVRKISEEGSELYRKGGRTDIYTSEIEPFTTELMKTLGENFLITFDTQVKNIVNEINKANARN